ncbi:hypothetical protein JZ751_028010 [Albula glossodonta]|uniref:Uncharacterized protein n=1 Tax=Albula glossodonta TaxID=121402 RepID=A0A8T2PIV0_9TELE|nr:hypothetical protein JZ751_028010 [Albula glossodonta]
MFTTTGSRGLYKAPVTKSLLIIPSAVALLLTVVLPQYQSLFLNNLQAVRQDYQSFLFGTWILSALMDNLLIEALHQVFHLDVDTLPSGPVHALAADAAEVVPVEDDADDAVLELLGHNVVEYDIQHRAEVHQEGGESSPGAVLMAAVLQEQHHKADVEGHKAHQYLHDEGDDDPHRLLLDLRLELGGAPVDQVVHDDSVAAHHDADGHQEEADEPDEVDRVVLPQMDNVAGLGAGGEVGGAVGVVVGEEEGGCTAQGHDPHTDAGHNGFAHVLELLAVAGLHYGHIAVSADQGEEPQGHTGVKDGQGSTDPTEYVAKGPLIQPIVNHAKREQYDENEVYNGHIDHSLEEPSGDVRTTLENDALTCLFIIFSIFLL